MPGFEVIGKEEQAAINEIFDKDKGILFAHGFDALRNNNFRVRNFEKAFMNKFNAKYGQAVTSGSTALLVALRAMGVRAGDEVITQSFTFVATVEAIMLLGAIPIITEIDETLNMDPADLQKKITKKTKVIVPVNMAGVPAHLEDIIAIAKKNGLKVLEDNAQGIGGKYKGKFLGTVGDAGSFSLDFGKTITTGEGGMILTNDEQIFNEALAFHDHGHEYNTSVGRADDTRHDWGFNFRMSELNGAVGLEQLKKLDRLLEKARYNKKKMKEALAGIKEIKFREIPEGSEEIADALIFYYGNKEKTIQALANLKKESIGTKNIPDALKWHFAGYWEHMFKEHPEYKGNQDLWPRSKDLLERSIALPVMVNWDDKFIDSYIDKVLKCLKV